MSFHVFALRQGGEVRFDGAIVDLPFMYSSLGVEIRSAGGSKVVSFLLLRMFTYILKLK